MSSPRPRPARPGRFKVGNLKPLDLRLEAELDLDPVVAQVPEALEELGLLVDIYYGRAAGADGRRRRREEDDLGWLLRGLAEVRRAAELSSGPEAFSWGLARAKAHAELSSLEGVSR